MLIFFYHYYHSLYIYTYMYICMYICIQLKLDIHRFMPDLPRFYSMQKVVETLVRLILLLEETQLV